MSHSQCSSITKRHLKAQVRDLNGTILPVSEIWNTTNALGHSESKTYDARFGAVKTLTGPNALTTTWEVDGFGRKTQELRADGTYTVWTYERCDAACPGTGVYRVFTQVYGVGGIQAAPTSAAYFDRLNRGVRQATQGFDGRWIYTDTDYDNQGRVKRSSRPYYALDPAYWTTPSYDDLGRTVRIDNPDGNWSTMTYNGLTTVATNVKNRKTWGHILYHDVFPLNWFPDRAGQDRRR